MQHLRRRASHLDIGTPPACLAGEFIRSYRRGVRSAARCGRLQNAGLRFSTILPLCEEGTSRSGAFCWLSIRCATSRPIWRRRDDFNHLRQSISERQRRDPRCRTGTFTRSGRTVSSSPSNTRNLPRRRRRWSRTRSGLFGLDYRPQIDDWQSQPHHHVGGNAGPRTQIARHLLPAGELYGRNTVATAFFSTTVTMMCCRQKKSKASSAALRRVSSARFSGIRRPKPADEYPWHLDAPRPLL